MAVFVEEELVFFVEEDETACFADEDDDPFRMLSRSSRVNEELLSTETSSSLGIVIECLSLEHPAIKKEIENADAKNIFFVFMCGSPGLMFVILI